MKFIIKEKNFESKKEKTKEDSYNLKNFLKSVFNTIKGLNSKLKKESIINPPKANKNLLLLKKNIFIIYIKKMMISFVLFNLFISISSKETIFKKIKVKLSYITIKIKSNGTNAIFFGYFSSACNPLFPWPKEVHINNVKQKVSSSYKFRSTDNEIKLFWDTKITSCNCLFLGCKNITEIDFSNFDSSEISTTSGMFYENESLTSA